MAVEPYFPEPSAPRFPPLPGSLAEAWNRYRRLQANEGHEDAVGLTVAGIIADENMMAAPARSWTDLEVKLRVAVFIHLMGGSGDKALAGISALGPIGQPLDEDVRLSDYGDRVIWSALGDAMRLAARAENLRDAAKSLDALLSDGGASPDDPEYPMEMALCWRGLQAAVAAFEGR